MNNNAASTSTTPENARPNAYHERTSAHAEELANRIIAFSQLAAAGAEQRKQSDSSVPPLPIPIVQPPQRASSNGANVRKVPPPPPRRRRSSTDETERHAPRVRSRSIDPSSLERFHSSGSDLSRSCSFIHKQKSIEPSDLNESSASNQMSQDLGKSSASLSSSRDFSSRDLNKTPIDKEPRKVRVTQFSDEPDLELESSESLPNHCDKKGRCINHSNIRLYKRQLLGGYSLIMETCPLCEVAKQQAKLEPSPRPSIVIKRSSSAGRAGKTMEKKVSSEYVRSLSLEKKSSLERRSSTSKRSLLGRVKSSRKGALETDASRSQREATLLDESNRSINYASDYESSENIGASPSGKMKPKLSARKAKSENEYLRTRGGTTFIDESNQSNNYIDDSEREVSKIPSPAGKRKPKLLRNAMSENEATRLRGGTTFLDESNRSRGAPPPCLKSLSSDFKTFSMKNSPMSSPRPILSRRTTSDTDNGNRRHETSFLRDDIRRKQPETGLVLDTSRSGSGSTVSSSPLDSPETPSTRQKLSLRRASDLSEDKAPSTGKEHSSTDNNQAPTSMLEKGLEKLSLLSRKGRSSSRGRSKSDVLTTKSLGSRARSEYSDATCDIVSLGHSSKPIQKSKSKRRQWDNTGRCKKHPSIILARKRPFSNGWDKLHECCPMCEEAKFEISTSRMNHLLGRDKSPSPSDFNANLHPREQISLAATEMNNMRQTEEPKRNRSRGKIDRSSRSDPRRSNNRTPVDNMSQQVPRVQKMPYTTPSGETGWYSGEVNEKGHPNGQGRMRMKTGNVVEGQWINGYSEQYIENEKRIKSGFGSNVAPWKQSVASPQYDSNTNSTRELQTQRTVPSESVSMSRQSQAVVQRPQQYMSQQLPHPQLQNQGYPPQQQQPPYSFQQSQHSYNTQPSQSNYNAQQQQQWYPQQGMMYGQMPSQQNHYM